MTDELQETTAVATGEPTPAPAGPDRRDADRRDAGREPDPDREELDPDREEPDPDREVVRA